MNDARTDWATWHDAYADPHSQLSRRLQIVQAQIRAALPARPTAPFGIVSICAGRGEDLIGSLRDYASADLVRARLVELDQRNVTDMRRDAQEAGLALEIVRGDAADPRLYDGAVPADLVLLCGVLGNISDEDARSTIHSLPQFCKPGATVIWTRSRRPPDRTPALRRRFRAAGFEELQFIAPQNALFSVGSCRFRGSTQPPRPGRLFTFTR